MWIYCSCNFFFFFRHCVFVWFIEPSCEEKPFTVQESNTGSEPVLANETFTMAFCVFLFALMQFHFSPWIWGQYNWYHMLEYTFITHIIHKDKLLFFFWLSPGEKFLSSLHLYFLLSVNKCTCTCPLAFKHTDTNWKFEKNKKQPKNERVLVHIVSFFSAFISKQNSSLQ